MNNQRELGQRVLDRRELLAGLALGVAGTGIGNTAVESGSLQQRSSLLSTLLGEPAVPESFEYYLPAVDADDRGVVIPVTVSVRDGQEGILVNVDKVELRHDIQLALRESLATAERVTEAKLDSEHVYVSFGVEGTDILALHGKSWEAGLTIQIIGALRAESPGRETLITGIVANDGTLLPVGGIEAKAQAARSFGAKRLLVPEQSTEQRTADASGIEIEPVSTIESAVEIIFD